ncbi:uncharacterized protein K452DRAFT_321849 [Aplosporella prunicola CBS 121167]|uniref:Uncharacterized protein n=1 Tax=Aplosporella prunicola CBS 121167 TaxID=1176127 RepID=A0A6A6B1N4_9PEZI|nr:uncharacterized protein K452DRAFT_321849 [Aplosporella prunicola CBS 121167]KAF2137283.1 hypothetical protein K452DRAFT_321849 [Aplosporella prunicola CBS 121167]
MPLDLAQGAGERPSAIGSNGCRLFRRFQQLVCSSRFAATIPGLGNFKGTIVHPQVWSEDLDYAGKDMVISGSGATAVTLLPNLTEKAKHVMMLQRSPSYHCS